MNHSPEKSQFTPIQGASSERVRSYITLPPYIDQESIVVDMVRLDTICKLAGISRLFIGPNPTGSEEGEAMIAGMNADGSAVGSVAASGKKLAESQRGKISQRYFKCDQEVDVKILLDMEAMARRVGEKGEEGLRSKRVWAVELNDAVTKEFQRQALAYLLSPTLVDVYIGIVPLLTAEVFFLLSSGHLSLMPMLTTIATHNMLGIIGEWRRLPLVNIGGVELSRAAVVAGMLHTRALIKAV